jgi:hypothetical protein
LSSQPSYDSQPGTDAPALFGAAWAVATLFHLGSHSGAEYLLLAASAWLLLSPASPSRLALLAIVQLFKTWQWAPGISNHWLLTAIVNATILGACLMLLVRNRRWPPAPADLLRMFAPAVRLELLTLYVFVVLHKLNSSFLDPEISCARMFLAAQAPGLLSDTALTRQLAVVVTIAVEAAIPVLLVGRRTRFAGVILALVFHAGVALNPLSGYYNFSAMVTALLTLFLPEEAAGRLRIRWQNRPRATSFGRAAAAVTAVAVGILVALRIARPADPVLVAWVAYAAVVLGVLICFRSDCRAGAERAELFSVRPRVLLVFPALTLLNGASPYLGLKTETAFAMYSNLRTEGRVTNHLLIPSSLSVFHFQDELVRITQSSDPFLQRLARSGRLIPYFELRRKPEASVTYVWQGTESAFERVTDDPRFTGRPNVLLRKLLIFRPVDPGLRQECHH